MKKFSIDYYEGEALKTNLDTEFDTVEDAGLWCDENYIPLSIIRITEWDNDNIDPLGVPEIIGSCNLDEAFNEEYTSLDF